MQTSGVSAAFDSCIYLYLMAFTEYGGKSKFARKKVQTDEYKHMDDLFRSGAHFPSDGTLPKVCEACSKQKKPFDGRGHEVCRLGAEAAHRVYFRDHDKPLVNCCKYN